MIALLTCRALGQLLQGGQALVPGLQQRPHRCASAETSFQFEYAVVEDQAGARVSARRSEGAKREAPLHWLRDEVLVTAGVAFRTDCCCVVDLRARAGSWMAARAPGAALATVALSKTGPCPGSSSEMVCIAVLR